MQGMPKKLGAVTCAQASGWTRQTRMSGRFRQWGFAAWCTFTSAWGKGT